MSTTVKNFANWRAEQIAKVALLNSGFNQVYEDPEHNFDFVAVSGATSSQLFMVDVKSSSNPRRSLPVLAKGHRNRLNSKRPVLVVVVDAEGGEGVFRLIEGDKQGETLPLNRDELEKILRLS